MSIKCSKEFSKCQMVYFVSQVNAVIIGDEELGSSYSLHQPKQGGFHLPHPYQSSSSTVADQSAKEGAAEVLGSDLRDSQKIRKRKRMSTFVPNSAQEEAAARHMDILPCVKKAVDNLQEWLSRADCPLASLSPHGSITAADESSLLDYITLESQKGILHPKLLFGATQLNPSDEKASDLFDCIHSNDSDEEREALAFDTPVLLPKRSRWLMSDLTKLHKLIPGK